MGRHGISGLWQSLAEPRPVTAIHVGVYIALINLGVATILMDHGALPVGIWSARMISAGAFLLGGLIGAPTAWMGSWWLERAATIIVGFGALSRVIAVVGMGDNYSQSHMLMAATAWTVTAAFCWVRYLRVRLAPFRPGSGPLLPAHEASLAVHRAVEAERRARN